MSESAHLSIGIIEGFNSEKPSAYASFSMATGGITAAQAAHVPGERMNSIWAVVNHLWFWNAVPLRMLQGTPVEPQDLGASDWSGWPAIGDPADEAAWQAATDRCLASVQAFAAAVKELSPERLEADMAGWGPAWAIIQGMYAHNAYHIGELVTLRHTQGLWIESKLT